MIVDLILILWIEIIEIIVIAFRRVSVSGSELVQLGLGSIFPNSGHLEGSSARGLQHFKGSKFYHSSKIWYTHICIWMRRGLDINIIAKQINMRSVNSLFSHIPLHISFPVCRLWKFKLECWSGVVLRCCCCIEGSRPRVHTVITFGGVSSVSHTWTEQEVLRLADQQGEISSCVISYVFLISELISHYMMINNVFTSRVWVCGGRLDTESSLSMSWRYRSRWRMERHLMRGER